MTKDLKVATWNVRGITHKEDELDINKRDAQKLEATQMRFLDPY
jgi:hypothetical protein